MINGLFLAFYSSMGGGTMGNLLFKWEQAGVFSYVLPFLLIFALLFGILSTLNLFGNNRAINAIIALAVGLMALQFNFVSIFFSEIFPRMGVALSIVLIVMVLVGFFARGEDGKPEKWFRILMIVVTLVIVVIVIFQSLEAYNWYTGFGWGFWWRYNWDTIIAIVLAIGALLAIVFASSGNSENKNPKFQMVPN